MRLLRTLVLTLAVLAAFTLDASAQMAVKKISFTTTSGTPPFDQAVTGVGLGVAGEAVIFFWTDQTAEGTAANQNMGFGAATSSTQRWAVTVANDDDVATTNSGRNSSVARCILIIDGAGSILAAADFKSFDGTDGNFTVTWQTNPGAGRIIHAIVIGGTDLTNAIATQIELNSTAGNQAYAHGLGAQPDFGFYATNNLTTTGSATNLALGVGWAVSDSKRGSVSINADDGATMTSTMDWNCVIATDRALIVLAATASAVNTELDHVSFDGTNVTFNQIDPAPAGTNLYALFLKGGQYDAGSFSARTTTGDDNITVAFTPKVMSFGIAQGVTTNRTVTADANMSFGAGTSTDGTAEGSISSAATDAVLNTQADQRTVTTKVLSSLVDGAPGSVDGEADLTALGTTSTINWTDAPAAADLVIWWAAGDAAAAVPAQTIVIGSAPRRRTVITSLEPREVEVVEVR